jgi:hypothetical protein
MKTWKIQQEIYHKLNQYHDDDLSLHNIEITENIIDNAIIKYLIVQL